LAPAAETRGLKRICPSCGTRYYDLNKRPVICPSCSTEFTGLAKVKTRRSRSAANDEIVPPKKVAAAVDDDDVAADDVLVSLDEVEKLEEGAEEEDLDTPDPDLEIEDDIEDIDDLEEVEADIEGGKE
jgi:uncharacterized protein (TIGR02300 family)